MNPQSQPPCGVLVSVSSDISYYYKHRPAIVS
jgi:hypothetical protein